MDPSSFNKELEQFVKTTLKVLEKDPEREYAPMVSTYGDEISFHVVHVEGCDTLESFVEACRGFGRHIKKEVLKQNTHCIFVAARFGGRLFIWGATLAQELNGAIVELQDPAMPHVTFPCPCQASFTEADVNPALAFVRGVADLS
jgi:hypothetical protein